MVKTRIVTRVKDKTGIAKSKNRSDDLESLKQKHIQFSKNLKFLITTIQANHDAMKAYSKSRLEVAKAINALTVNTPMFQAAGDIPASAIGTVDGGGDDENPTSSKAAKAANNNNAVSSTAIVAHDSNPLSFAAVHLQLHKKSKLYHRKYVEHILTYASDWERILSTRVNKHLKHAEKLRVDLDHYQKKVEDINKDVNKTMNKGKSVSDKGVDKLKRNEQKLVNARREYDQFISDLCGFMEEIMERGWKDLHPLLVKMAQFDVTLSGEEAQLLSKGMVAVVNELKALAGKHPNMNPTGRLKELETWSLESINKTNPKADNGPLMITGGDEFGALQKTSSDEIDVGGGGLFGSAPNSRNPSMTDLTGAPRSRAGTGDSSNYGGLGRTTSANDSFDWNSGIAPASVTQNAMVPVASAPSSSYGLPPLPRQGSNVASPQPHAGSSNSMVPMLNTMQAAAPPPTLNDIFGGGGAPPPAPASTGFAQPSSAGMPPPPPPVMPPPPPPQSPPNMTMYNSSPMVNASPMMNSSPMTQPPTIGMSQMSMGAGAPSGVNTNPFDDPIGSSGHAAPPMATGNALGGGYQAAQKPPTNPFEI